MKWDQLLIPIASGIAVAAILAAARSLWRHKRMPTGMSRRVTRRNYLLKILAMSRDERVERLDAMVPNLIPGCGSPVVRDIQLAWAQINQRRGVRVLTREDQQSLTAGAELLSQGIEVRVARELNTGHISYHVFEGDVPYVVLNQRGAVHDRPEKLEGASLSKVFRSNFERSGTSSVPLESLLAEQILGGLHPTNGGCNLVERVRETRAKYRLDARAEDAVLLHLAFRHSAPVVFVTGLPGAGKSLVRRRLTKKLSGLRFQVDEQCDYVYAFVDFLHSLMQLGDGRGMGFSAEAGGAFCVDHEERLQSALHALGNRVWQNRRGLPLTLVEFARSDVVAALRVFGDEVLQAAQVIHVRAPDAVRAARLATRGQPPQIHVADQSIRLLVSDEHRLPSGAADALYARDNVSMLLEQKNLAGRVHLIDNGGEADYDRIEAELDRFVSEVARPYRALAASSGAGAKPPSAGTAAPARTASL